MDYEEFASAAKGFGIKIGFMSKGLYRLLAPQIDSRETIALIAEGLDKASANRVPVVVTNRTIYAAKYRGIMGGLDFVAIPLSRVTSVESSGGLLGGVTIYEGTTTHIFEGIPSLRALELVTIIRERIGSSTPVVVSASTPADEIKKYKELLDSGAINQHEYDAKKKQLLGI